MRADVLGSGGVRSASAVVIGAGGDVRSRSNSASRPSTRDFFRRSTSSAISSMRLVSAWMASSSSSFVADSRRRRRVQLCVAVLCSGRRLLGAKLWATASSAMHSVLCIVQTGFLTAVLAGLYKWRFGKAASSLAGSAINRSGPLIEAIAQCSRRDFYAHYQARCDRALMFPAGWSSGTTPSTTTRTQLLAVRRARTRRLVVTWRTTSLVGRSDRKSARRAHS